MGMTGVHHEIISAQVVLKSAGSDPTGTGPLNRERILQYKSSPETARRARAVFVNAGFNVGPFVGASFDISAEASAFQSLFELDVEATDKGSYVFVLRDGKAVAQLPALYLPDELADVVDSVTFPPPADAASPSH